MSDATSTPAGSPAISALDAIGDAFKQLALAVQALVVAVWHGAAEAGQVLMQQPATLIAGIAIGLLVALLAWLCVWLARRFATAARPHATQGGVEATPETKTDLQTLPIDQVEKQLGSSPNGLTQAEATKRLTKYGPNEIEEKRTNAILSCLRISGDRSPG